MKGLLFIFIGIGIILYENLPEKQNTSLTPESFYKGDWQTEREDAKTISLYKATNGKWFGKIKTSDKSGYVGKYIFKNGVFEAGEGKIVGTLVKPDGTLEVDATITAEDATTLKLVAKKYFLSKTLYWTK